MDIPILYSFRRCPYAMRARLAIAQANKKVELREIILRDKPKEMCRASPKATVPVLILSDGSVIDESVDIMHWALGSIPSLELQLIKDSDQNFKPWLDRYKYANQYPELSREDILHHALVFLDDLEKRLGINPFLFGKKRSCADLAIMPFIRQFAHVDRDWFFAQPYPKIIESYKNFVTWDGFLAIMQKHPKWEDGAPPLYFPV